MNEQEGCVEEVKQEVRGGDEAFEHGIAPGSGGGGGRLKEGSLALGSNGHPDKAHRGRDEERKKSTARIPPAGTPTEFRSCVPALAPALDLLLDKDAGILCLLLLRHPQPPIDLTPPPARPSFPSPSCSSALQCLPCFSQLRLFLTTVSSVAYNSPAHADVLDSHPGLCRQGRDLFGRTRFVADS